MFVAWLGWRGRQHIARLAYTPNAAGPIGPRNSSGPSADGSTPAPQFHGVVPAGLRKDRAKSRFLLKRALWVCDAAKFTL
jgi:hypothetical protein